MFKQFGTSKEVFVNQDEGMFVALAITLDTNIHTLETEAIGGRTYAKAGSVVKEGDVVRGILAESYELENGRANARVVVEGYCWASMLTNNALNAVSSLPKIVVMPYKAIVLRLENNNSLAAILHIEGAKFASNIGASDLTISGATVTSVKVLNGGTDLRITVSQAGDISVTAIASDGFIGGSGAAVKGLPINFTSEVGTKNAVTVTAGDNGTASVDKATAAEGQIVTITAAGSQGYIVDKVTVDGTEISKVSGSYTFVMPDRAVAVVATFKAE